MADASYTLTLSPLIDSVLQFEIGEKRGNRNRKKGTIKNVGVKEGEIHLLLQVGGIKQSPWSLEIEVEMDGDTYQTVPKTIKGKIPNNGTDTTDKNFKLKKKKDDEEAA